MRMVHSTVFAHAASKNGCQFDIRTKYFRAPTLNVSKVALRVFFGTVRLFEEKRFFDQNFFSYFNIQKVRVFRSLKGPISGFFGYNIRKKIYHFENFSTQDLSIKEKAFFGTTGRPLGIFFHPDKSYISERITSKVTLSILLRLRDF